jgi:trehalose/maltose hydrolase-like predicted phosphorylase
VPVGDAGDSLGVAPIEAARYLGDSVYSTRFSDVKWNNSAWTLTTTTPRQDDWHAMAFTANGYFGTSMASIGPFVQFFNVTNGWPVFNGRQTFGTVAGFFDRQNGTEGSNFPWLYQYGWDSVISGIPHWGPIIIELEDGSYLDSNTSLSQLSNVALTQDFKQGLAEWSYTWTPESSDVSINITFTAFADKLNINNGYVRLQAVPSEDINVSIVNVLDGANAVRTNFVKSGEEGSMIYSAVSPVGVENVTAWVYAGLTGSSGTNLSQPALVKDKAYVGKFEASIAQAVNITLRANKTTTVVKHVGVASTDGFANPRDTAKNAALSSMGTSFESCLQNHSQEWGSIMPTTSISDYTLPWTGLLPESAILIEKQITSVVSSFSLLMNTIGPNALALAGDARVNSTGLSVCGLTSDCYGGQRFWDQDVWMHPQLATSFPGSAKQITNLRVAQYPQAKENVKTAYQSSQNGTKFSEDAALFPWTSGRDANCTATGPCFDYEYHLNGDIIRSFVVEWASSGDSDYLKNELLPVMRSISTAYSDLLVKNGSRYELYNLTDPDEYANGVDNGGFTMALISNVLNDTNTFQELFGETRAQLWDDQAVDVYTPSAGDISLEYSGMNGSIEVKQADVVLKIYPLSEAQNYTLVEQRADLDYYAAKQSSNGPGMTFAIFSIDANAVSPSGCSAFTYDENSWSPYLRAPWFSFSEQLIDEYSENGGTNPAYPFLTGHGGFLQVDTFGYLGLRRTVDYYLRVDPSLPPQIEHLAYPVVYHQGWPVQAVSNATHTTLTRRGKPLDTANKMFADQSIEVMVGKDRSTAGGKATMHSLRPNGTITVQNRMYSQNLSEANNLLQCRSVRSSGATQPGLFPNGAIDGAASTSWQPSTNGKSSLTVDTSDVPFQRLESIRFDWGAQPATNATVTLHNYTDASTGRSIVIDGIEISNAYDAVEANKVQPVGSNTTSYRFNETVWSGNYVTLMIEGNQFNNSERAPGATVAEFVLVGALGPVVD